jgi:hypothetical protein
MLDMGIVLKENKPGFNGFGSANTNFDLGGDELDVSRKLASFALWGSIYGYGENAS